jgi:hypothetical protein
MGYSIVWQRRGYGVNSTEAVVDMYQEVFYNPDRSGAQPFLVTVQNLIIIWNKERFR